MGPINLPSGKQIIGFLAGLALVAGGVGYGISAHFSNKAAKQSAAKEAAFVNVLTTSEKNTYQVLKDSAVVRQGRLAK